MLDRRVQILLDRERHRRLSMEARRQRRSVASLIRDAIDEAFPAVRSGRAAAGREILEAEPMPVPEPEDLRAELETLRGRRG